MTNRASNEQEAAALNRGASSQDQKPASSLAERIGISVGCVVGIVGVAAAIVTEFSKSPTHWSLLGLYIGISLLIGWAAYIIVWGLGIWLAWLIRGTSQHGERKKLVEAVLVAVMLLVVVGGGAAFVVWAVQRFTQ